VSSRRIVPIVLVAVACVVAVGGTVGVMLALRPADAAASTGAPDATPVAAVEAEQATPAGSEIAGEAPATPAASGVATEVADLLPDGALDPAAVRAGFADSPYAFTSTVTGFPSYTAMGATWTGSVRDTTHYVLEFPAGGSLTRYERTGADRTAYLGRLPVTVAGGDGSMRTPDDLLPVDLYAAAIEPWTKVLPGEPRGDTYIADSDRLTAMARGRGLDASRWALTVAVDLRGRLTSAVFTGAIRGRGFRMELQVTYLDQSGTEYGRTARPGATPAATAEPSAPAQSKDVATPQAARPPSLLWGLPASPAP
jgi:hypothetical protein